MIIHRCRFFKIIPLIQVSRSMKEEPQHKGKQRKSNSGIKFNFKQILKAVHVHFHTNLIKGAGNTEKHIVLLAFCEIGLDLPVSKIPFSLP